MTDIGELRGITPEVARKLRYARITTIEELWERIGDDSGSRIDDVARQADITLDKLIDLLAEQDVYGGRSGPFPQPSYRLIMLVALLIGGILLFLAGHAIRLAFRPVDQVVVIADAELPAHHVIGRDDVTRKKIPRESGSLQTKEEVIGRYPLKAIPAGATLHSDQFSKARLSLTDIKDRHLLSIPVKAQALSTTVRPTEHVSIVLSPRSSGGDTPQAVIKNDVIVWGIDRRSDVASITVALTQEDLEVMKALLGISDVFVVHPSPWHSEHRPSSLSPTD